MSKRKHRNVKQVEFDVLLSSLDFKTSRTVKPKQNKFGVFTRFVLASTSIGLVASIFVIALLLVGFVLSTPFVQAFNNTNINLDKVDISSNIEIVDKNGDVFATIYSQEREKLTSLEQVGKTNIDALISTEDKRFYEHKGIDTVATVRAFVTGNGGGSGLTQQLVKNLLFYDINATAGGKVKATEYSVARKLRELKLALGYEKTHSKDDILLEYFNTVAFGSGNIYGIQSASKYFFGKNANELSLAQSSALVGTVNNPNLFFLSNDSNVWKQRQKIVLDSMLDNGKISRQDYDNALSQELVFQSNKTFSGCSGSKYPFYCESVVKELLDSEKYGVSKQDRERFFNKGGFVVRTPLDPDVQNITDSVLSNGFGDTSRIVAPTVVVDPKNSNVKALSVNRKWGNELGQTTINPLTHPSGTGSVFKMITLASALEQGWKEKDLVFAGGCSVSFPGYDAPPGGFTNSSSCALQGGRLNYEQATAYSSNTWFVSLLKKVGVNNTKKFAKSVGLSSAKNIGDSSLAYTLGVSEESPISMASAFATFVNDGVYCPPVLISQIVDKTTNKPLLPNDEFDEQKYSCKRVLKPENASIVLKAMHANVSGSIRNAFGVDAKLSVDSVGKSGTNQLYNSTWVQATSDDVLFTNVYDFDLLTRGVENVMFNGRNVSWHDNVAKKAGSSILRQVYNVRKPVGKLNFSTQHRKGISPKVSEIGFVRTPSVIGIKVSNAVSILQNLGYNVRIDNKQGFDKSYPAGVVVAQNVVPGTKISVNKKHTIVLVVNGD